MGETKIDAVVSPPTVQEYVNGPVQPVTVGVSVVELPLQSVTVTVDALRLFPATGLCAKESTCISATNMNRRTIFLLSSIVFIPLKIKERFMVRFLIQRYSRENAGFSVNRLNGILKS